MANRLSFKPNFVNYMFKDDMICDALKTVFVTYNFDSEKSKNPFLLHSNHLLAFLRRISMEKKQLEIKNKILEKTDFDEVFDANELDSNNWSDYNSIKDAFTTKRVINEGCRNHNGHSLRCL